jgi:hypothetical protein
MKFLIRLLCVACVGYTAYHLYLGEPNPHVQVVTKEIPVVIERPVRVARQAPSSGSFTRIITEDHRGQERTVWTRK